MYPVDLSSNARIPLLMELVKSFNRLTDPQELIQKLSGATRREYHPLCSVQLSTRGLRAGEYRIARLSGSDGPPAIEYEGLQRLTQLPACRGGAIGRMIASGMPGIWHEVDLRDDPVLGSRLAGFRSAMVCPLFENEFGLNWSLLLAPPPDAFDEQDLEEMILRSNMIAAMVSSLETARQLMQAGLKIREEIEQIGRIQRALLPEELPEIPGLRLAASYRTFDRAGGDMYDICPIGRRGGSGQASPVSRWGLLIGDVSGHGPAAAVVMAMVHSILHTYPSEPHGPAEILEHVNRHLCAKRIEQSFVTAFLGFYEVESRRLVYARAGHEPPILKDFPHRGAPLRLEAVGEPPLGILPETRYSQAEIILQPGQTLILYTDGVTDAGHRRGRVFGIQGIEQSLVQCTGEPHCAIRHITEALLEHQADDFPDDDQTIVAIQVV